MSTPRELVYADMILDQAINSDSSSESASGSRSTIAGCSVANSPSTSSTYASARHSRGEIAPRGAEHHYRAAGHVFATVVAHAFDYRVGAGVAHREALPGDAAEVRFARDRAVEHDVAGDDVFARLAAELGRGLHRDAPPGKAFAAVVVRVADQIERHPFARKAPKLWPADPAGGCGRCHRAGPRARSAGRCGTRASCRPCG